MCLLLIISQTSFSQKNHTTKNNYTGNWETPTSWSPVWNPPNTTIIDFNIVINGYISCNGPLTFSGNSDTLFVNDTLVVYGDLNLGNNNDIIVNSNGILIVRGNIVAGNQAQIIKKSNSYIVITGDYIKVSVSSQGKFFSDDIPSNVFVGGTVQPGLSPVLFPVFNCPGTYPYDSTHCNYGNMADLKNSSIYPFFQSTCKIDIPTITASGPLTFCENDSVTLTSSSGTTYLWSTGAVTSGINVTTAGSYTVRVTDASGCQSAASTVTIITVNALPVVNAGIDTIIPFGTSTTIDATVTDAGICAYSWSPSAKLVNALVVDPTTINLTTTTVFTLTATSTTTLCSNTDAVRITVSGGALSSIPSANPGIICAGDKVELDALASGGSGSYTYNWSSVPAGFTSTEAYPIVNPSDNTTYHVAVFDGFASVNSQVDVTVNALPIPTISITDNSGIANNDGIICKGDTTTLSAAGGISYKWSSGETTAEIKKYLSGDYTVTVTDANGCRNIKDTTVIINALPQPLIILTENSGIENNDEIICEGDNATLTASGGVSYSWSTGEAVSEIIKNITGTYFVTVTDINNCQNSNAAALTVNSLPSATITFIDNSGNANNDGLICEGDNATLTALGGESYNWSTGEVAAEIIKNASGTYTVTVTDANNCQNSNAVTLTVNSLPSATITITDNLGNAKSDGLFCAGDTAILTASGGLRYSWSTGETTPDITKDIAGTYYVTVTDANSCENTANSNINILNIETDAGMDNDVCGQDYNLQATSNTGSGLWTVNSDAGNIIFNPDEKDPAAAITVNQFGSYQLTWTAVNDKCKASSDVIITFHDIPNANAGIDQELNNVFTTKMEAELSSSESGEWSVLSGSGYFDDNNSPVTEISNLSIGDNIFLWTIKSGNCNASDSVVVNVSGLFIPQVITPNGDFKNDYFIIKDIEFNGPAELVIFNRWGIEVYNNPDYKNEWDGRSNSGDELSNDTYFYVLKLGDGKISKGFVVIKK